MGVIIESDHLPPTLNHLFANVPGKGRVKSESYRTWRSAFMWDAKLAKVAPIKGHYRMTIMFSEAGRRSNTDLSNRGLKAIEDALVELGTLEDDSLADSISLAWGDCRLAMRIEIEAV